MTLKTKLKNKSFLEELETKYTKKSIEEAYAKFKEMSNVKYDRYGELWFKEYYEKGLAFELIKKQLEEPQIEIKPDIVESKAIEKYKVLSKMESEFMRFITCNDLFDEHLEETITMLKSAKKRNEFYRSLSALYEIDYEEALEYAKLHS